MSENESDSTAAEEAAIDNANVLNPVIGLSAADLAKAGASIIGQAIKRPLAGVEQTANLLVENVRILAGTSELAPHPKDRRFADQAFADQPVYRRVAQSWLALERGLRNWVDAAEFEDEDQERARFVTQLVADALAPTNYLLGNPSALRRARETSGKSLLNGVKNLTNDLINNGGMPSQVDTAPFTVGWNLASTPGAVVFEHPIAELIQYAPTTKRVRSRPLFIVPPQINKFYLYDLSPEKSLARYLVDQGFQVFIVSWRNPTAEERDWGLAEYIEALEESIDAACAITGQDSVDAVGACAGGITLSSALAYLAALGRDEKLASLTLMVNVLETDAKDSVVNLFMNDEVIEAARKRSARTGVLDGESTARVFSWMRPNDLIWNYVISNYLHGDKPPAFDVLFWNDDTTRLPARLHNDFLNIFKDNPFQTAGGLMIRDVPLDIGKVTCPVFITGGTTDHITPWQACYRSTQLFKGDVTFVLSTAGHIQSILNPPGPSKRRYLTNTHTPADHSDWLENATENDGSWWPYWVEWLQDMESSDETAPTDAGDKNHPVIRPAPGKYVFE